MPYGQSRCLAPIVRLGLIEVQRAGAALAYFDEETGNGEVAMNGFSADWLHLREPFDHAARGPAAATLALPDRLARWRRRSRGRPLAVIDLACGHGANLRTLAPLLGGAQHWRLVDHDPTLLAAVPDALAAWAHRHAYRFSLGGGAGNERAMAVCGPNFDVTVVRQHADLASGGRGLDLGQSPLVTASALLDLVSRPWLQTLVKRARAARAAVWFGLTVDGRTTWDPADPADKWVHGLFSEHQGWDKGFGPAMGTQAASVALQQLELARYETSHARTDWVVDGRQAPQMVLAMLDGMTAAAREQDPVTQEAVQSWRTRRAAVAGSSCLRVGHVDILATPV